MDIFTANTPLAQGILAMIEEAGLKQIAVAKKAGYSKQEFNDMLNGRKLIKACDIPNIAAALGVKPNDLYAKGVEIKSESATV